MRHDFPLLDANPEFQSPGIIIIIIIIIILIIIILLLLSLLSVMKVPNLHQSL